MATRQRVLRVKSLIWVTFFKFILRVATHQRVKSLKLGYLFQIVPPNRVAMRQRVLRVKSLIWVTFFKFFLREWLP